MKIGLLPTEARIVGVVPIACALEFEALQQSGDPVYIDIRSSGERLLNVAVNRIRFLDREEGKEGVRVEVLLTLQTRAVRPDVDAEIAIAEREETWSEGLPEIAKRPRVAR